MTDEELIEIFGDEFRDILNQLDAEVPDALDGLIRSVFNALAFEVGIFGFRIEQHIERLLSQGMSQGFISESLLNDFVTGGRIFGELKRGVAGAIQELTNQAGRLGMLEQYGEKYKEWKWVTVAGHKICPDCDKRGGRIETWEQWLLEGLPGSGWSVCRGYCYCVLDPTGTIDDKIVADVRESGA